MQKYKNILNMRKKNPTATFFGRVSFYPNFVFFFLQTTFILKKRKQK